MMFHWTHLLQTTGYHFFFEVTWGLKPRKLEVMAATLMAATSGSGTVLKPTPFLGQGKASNGNPLRDVVSMGSGKYSMVLSLSLLFLYWVIVWVSLRILFGCVCQREEQWAVVWTRQSEILRTVFSSNTFILEGRISRWLWMGHCWLICWPRSICQEQGSWGHSFLLTL